MHLEDGSKTMLLRQLPACGTARPRDATTRRLCHIATSPPTTTMAKQPLINGETGVGLTLPSTTGLCILRPVYLNGVNENSFHILPSNFLCTAWPRIRGEALTYEQYST